MLDRAVLSNAMLCSDAAHLLFVDAKIASKLSSSQKFLS